MTEGHTIAPWRLNAGNSTVIMGGNQVPIARAECGGMTGIKLPEAEANARLIAAAPCLFDALKDAVEIMDDQLGGDFPDTLAHFRAVLARAMGAA